MREIKYKALLDGEFIHWESGDKSNWFWEQVRNYELTPLQYTGLKDKNGVEIYEGDVVDRKYRFHVIHRNGCFFATSRANEMLLIDLLDLRQRAQCPVEIIGNIYESPELLEEE